MNVNFILPASAPQWRRRLKKPPGGQSLWTGHEYDGETTAEGCGSAPAGENLNLAGRLTMVGNTAATVKYQEYDGIGRVKQSRREMAGGGPWQFAYSYNDQGLTSMTYPSGRMVTTTYDNGGRPNSVAGYASSTFNYLTHGATSVMTLANGVVETTSYNNRLQPTSITAGSLLSLGFSYGGTDNNGNVLSQTIAGLNVTQTYTYDYVNRISSASEPSAGTPWSQSYSYTTDGSNGRFGNLSQTGDGLSASLLCGSYNAATNHCADSGFGYDNAGNLTAYATRTLAYDAENRQTTLSDGGSYEYDGEGRRVKKVAAGVTTVYVYDAFGKLAAEYATLAPSNQPDCTRCYLTPDHLGSTRLVTDGTGAVKRRYDYFPFGGEINPGYGNRSAVTGYVTTDWSNPKFTGKPRDYESGLGLDYFGARYFSGVQGRFTSTDPLNIPNLRQLAPEKFAEVIANPQNWNAYAYAHNNPLAKLDPDGFLTIIVPGTWNNHEEWEDSEFRKRVEKSFGEKAVVVNNAGMKNDKAARTATAKMIQDLVKNHNFAEGEQLNIVAHSHGGNAAFEATKNMDHRVDNLVTLGTPNPW